MYMKGAFGTSLQSCLLTSTVVRLTLSVISLTKLMVSHDLLRSTVTKQTAFDQRDSKSISNFERTIDRCCQAMFSSFFWFPNWKSWISSVLTNCHGFFRDLQS